MNVKITVIGKVHDVGYRPFLLDLAGSLLIERFDARNVKGKQTVIITYFRVVNQFVELVKIEKPENAIVKGIKVKEYKLLGRYTPCNVRRIFIDKK